MKKIILGLVIALIAFGGISTHEAQARGRYGSHRVGGTNSHGKGSHYVGGNVRSCHGSACR